MEGCYLLSLLLLLVLCHAPSPGLAKCTATNETVVHKGEVKVVSERNGDGGKRIYVSLYVRAETSFKGMNLTATTERETEGRRQTVLFSHFIEAGNNCFKKDKWMMVAAWVNLEDRHSLGFLIGACRKECAINNSNTATDTTAKYTVQGLNITAHWKSKWGTGVSGTDCTPIGLTRVDPPSTYPSCTQEILQPPPTTSTSSQSPHSVSPASVSSGSKVVVVVGVPVGVMVVGTVVVAMVACWARRKRRGVATEEPASHTHTVVRENSLYEAFDYQETAAGETAQVIENEIYEPFDHEENAVGGATEIIENDFYENADGVTEDTEDDTYERLSYYANYDNQQ